MNRIVVFLAAAMLAGAALATSFTDLNNATYWGKTGIKKLTETLDANFALIEAGSIVAGTTSFTVSGTEGGNASAILDADEGDDNADTWTIRSTAADNDLDFLNHTSTVFSLNSSGLATSVAGVTITDADGAAVFTATGFEANNASLVLDADEGDDAADTWTVTSAAADNDLDIINDSTTAASLTAAGVLSVLGGIDGIGAVDIDIGSADITDVTIVTDSTGDAEVVLPDGSIGSSEILDGAVAAADLATAVQDRVAYVTIAGANLAAAGTGTVTIQAKDAAGNDLAEVVFVRTWIGTANDYGVDALTDYSVSTGTSKEEVTANGEYLAISDATGKIVMAVDNGGAGTVYAWCEFAGKVYATGAVQLTAP